MKIRVRIEAGYRNELLDIVVEDFEEDVALKLRHAVLDIIANASEHKELEVSNE